MRYQFYTTSEATWRAMLVEIEKATKSIYIEMYIMVDDTPDFNFFELLEKKARSGVSIKLILDSFGSFALSSATVERLKQAGAEVIFFSAWLHRLHRKIVIIDKRLSIAGGVNIHRSARLWADLVLLSDSASLTRAMLISFSKTYVRSGGTDLMLRDLAKKNRFIKKVHERLSDSVLYTRHHMLKQYYKETINEAKESIMLVTPYFIPAHWLLAVLDQAALRGVACTVIIPKQTDSAFIDRANYHGITKVAKSHITFFLYPRMNHAKMLIADGKEAIVGSLNLDSLSFERNFEAGVSLTDPAMVNDLVKIFLDWKGESTEFIPDHYRMRWFDYLLLPFIKLLYPFL